MKIKLAFKFANRKPIVNWEAVYNDIASQMNLTDKVFNMVITVLRKPKTYSQLGYFHAEIIKKWIMGLREAGHNVPVGKRGEDYAKYIIKTLPSINFTEEKTNPLTGKVKTVLRSFSDATKEEMSHVIDEAILNGSEYFGIIFESPEVYKKKLKLRS